MGIFFSLFFESITCLFYGIVIAVFIMATLYFILKTLSRGIVRSIPFFLTGVILSIFLVVNMSVVVGAISIKQQTGSMKLWLTQQLENVEGIADVQSSQAVGDILNEEFPLLGCFLNLFDMSGYPMNELPQVFYDVINKEMNGIICSKLLWSLAIIIAAVLIALYFEKGGNVSKSIEYDNVLHKDPDDF